MMTLSKADRQLLRMPASSKIMVTRHVIDNSVRCDTKRCILHNAILDAYPHAQNIWVDAAQIRIKLDNVIHYAATPKHCWLAVLAYDTSREGEAAPVEPFSFNLKVREARRSVPASRERKDQINAARNKRAAEGRPDRVYRRIAGRQLTEEAFRQVKIRVRQQLATAAA
jgi:hypothetical protein